MTNLTMNIQETNKELDEIITLAQKQKLELNRIARETKKHERDISTAANVLGEKVGDVLEKDAFLKFFKMPYAVIPFGKNKVLVVVPKFVKDFQVGWLWKETDSFYIYQFDQYSAWLGDALVDLLESINFKKGFELTIEGNNIVFPAESKQAIKDKLKYHLSAIGDNEAKITRGHVFDVIAESIEQGCLPFKALKGIAWLKPDGKPNKEWKLFETRATAWDAAGNAAGDASWDAARNASWDAARDAALYGRALVSDKKYELWI